jgi:hypothetical protein
VVEVVMAVLVAWEARVAWAGKAVKVGAARPTIPVLVKEAKVVMVALVGTAAAAAAAVVVPPTACMHP